MPQNPPYLPAQDALAGPWADNFSTILTADPTDYGLVAGDATAVAAVVTPWLAALAAATNPGTRGPASIAAKDSARAAMEAVVRPYAVQISQNPLVPAELKTTIGVTNRVTTKTRNSVVAAEATIAVTYTTGGIPQIRASDPSTPDSVKRPLGATMYEIQVQRSADGDPPWTAYSSEFSSRPIYTLDPELFDGAPVTYRFRVRWIGGLLPGGGANFGPWSDWSLIQF